MIIQNYWKLSRKEAGKSGGVTVPREPGKKNENKNNVNKSVRKSKGLEILKFWGKNLK